MKGRLRPQEGVGPGKGNMKTVNCESCSVSGIEVAATTHSVNPDFCGYELCDECAAEYDSRIMEHRLLATVRHIREKMDAHQLNFDRFEAIGYEAFKAEEAAMEAEYTVAREALWAHHDKIRGRLKKTRYTLPGVRQR